MDKKLANERAEKSSPATVSHHVSNAVNRKRKIALSLVRWQDKQPPAQSSVLIV